MFNKPIKKCYKCGHLFFEEDMVSRKVYYQWDVFHKKNQIKEIRYFCKKNCYPEYDYIIYNSPHRLSRESYKKNVCVDENGKQLKVVKI